LDESSWLRLIRTEKKNQVQKESDGTEIKKNEEQTTEKKSAELNGLVGGFSFQGLVGGHLWAELHCCRE
jgi:hypothetical protein